MFGSARTPRDDPYYAAARDLARRLGEDGFAVITGGGPGIMEAANRGAEDAGVPSIGLGIELPHEQAMNEWVGLPLEFHYFFTRKVMFVRYASAFVVFPGGFGTFDELFEAATLRQTEKIRDFPIMLFGTSYWRGLVDWLADPVAGRGQDQPPRTWRCWRSPTTPSGCSRWCATWSIAARAAAADGRPPRGGRPRASRTARGRARSSSKPRSGWA